MALNRWTGVWTAIANLRRWGGANWINLTFLRRWDGSKWVQIWPVGTPPYSEYSDDYNAYERYY